MPNSEKNIIVSCAIIRNDAGEIMAAQRSEMMSQPLSWEFPGGKIEYGETAEACLHREIMEELRVEINILASLPPVVHSYETFVIELHPFICTLLSAKLQLTEHKAVIFGNPEILKSLPWAIADVKVLKGYLEYLEAMKVR